MISSYSTTTEQEDVNFWRREAETNKKKFIELQEEIDDFRQGSAELEKELESHVKILERNNQELKINNSKLYNESQNYKRKFDQLNAQHNQEISELNIQLTQNINAKESLKNYIRELEQSNDDLERAKRAAIVSLDDFEVRLNQAIERNALLESELGEKDQLVETVQRLKDKAKANRNDILMDIVENIDTISTKLNNSSTKKSSKFFTHSLSPNVNSNCQIISNTTAKLGICSNSSTTPNNSYTNSPLTPSSRVNALNLVSELIKKVGAIENKLASCRNFGLSRQSENIKNRHSTLKDTITNTNLYNGVENKIG
ncbi:nuclear distribution protein nudE-like 1-A isoform X2 [Gordionus sp. m RMFG-2023]|uniref:nuclear distribution protein nudE-like 1-A isoform X2 n=1 Tax=Gordionus sp. m RMFG-2023 TaxID=3053472 RepID=UPI0031FE10C6